MGAKQWLAFGAVQGFWLTVVSFLVIIVLSLMNPTVQATWWQWLGGFLVAVMLLAIFSGIGWLIVGLVYDHLFKKPFKCLNPYPELIVISFVVMVLLPPLSPITNWTQVLWMFVGTALTVKTFDYLNWKQPTE